MIKRCLTILLFILSPSAEGVSFATHACGTDESWTFSQAIAPKWQTEFKQNLSRKTTPVWGFSQALGLRRIAEDAESLRFAEYWVSRALYDAGLLHIAQRGFETLAKNPPSAATIGVQVAALECLLVIQSRYPTLTLDKSVYAQFSRYIELGQNLTLSPIIREAASLVIMDLVATERPASELKAALRFFDGDDFYSMLSRAVIHARANESQKAVVLLKPIMAKSAFPPRFTRFLDPLRILYARVLFETKDFDRAIEQLKLVKKSSNELGHALTELSWAFLVSERYKEAIGTSLNLLTGGLRKTFSPEAPMVMSMAFNELCQYPKAIQAIDVLRAGYALEFNWLTANAQSQPTTAYYDQALRFLKQQDLNAPERIVGEWVRSPHFIARQDEINLLFTEKDSTAQLGEQGDREQSTFALELLKTIKEFKKRYQKAKIKLAPGEALSPAIFAELDIVREKVNQYRRFRNAAPVWRNVLRNHEQRAPVIAKVRENEIVTEFSRISKRMLIQLQEVAENTYFIEVEIFNGASNDMIWKNAYPDYEKIAKDLERDRAPAQAAPVLNWGSVTLNLSSGGEIWEDELGSFKADVYDNCENKTKYLAIKKEDALRHAKKILVRTN